jgi:hypothetical protein
MPIGHAAHEEYDKSPDTTPVLQYNVRVSQRDLDEIKHLVDRNFAGMTIAWLPVSLAVTKVLQQINDQDKDNAKLDNYDSDGTVPTYSAPQRESEIEDPYD